MVESNKGNLLQQSYLISSKLACQRLIQPTMTMTQVVHSKSMCKIGATHW